MLSRLLSVITVSGICGFVTPTLSVAQSSQPLVAQASTGSPASSSSSTALDEIIVTAQKREQNINDVGMSITAISNRDLQTRGINAVEGLTAIEPSLQVSKSNFGTSIYTIRGVGYNDQSLAASPTVTVYQDEVAYSYSSLTKGAFLDVDHVEILKGPQGTLYGQNATGGAVNIVAAKPTDHLAMGTDWSVSNFGETQLQGFISGPLTDTLSARLAVSIDEGGAWQQSTTRDDALGTKDKKIARLLLAWRPNDKLAVNANINGWWDNSQAQAYQLEGFRFANPDYIQPPGHQGANPADYLPSAALYSYYPANIRGELAEPISLSNNRAADWVAGTHPTNDEHYYQGVLRVDYSITDNIGVTVLATDETYNQHDQIDYAGLDVVGFNGLLNGWVHTNSEELRLHGVAFDSKLNWILGANYEKDKSFEQGLFNNIDSSSYAVAGAPFSLFPPAYGFVGPWNNFGATSTDNSRTTSVFGNVGLRGDGHCPRAWRRSIHPFESGFLWMLGGQRSWILRAHRRGGECFARRGSRASSDAFRM